MKYETPVGTFSGEYEFIGFRRGKKVLHHKGHNLVMDRLTMYQLQNSEPIKGTSIQFGSGSAEPTSSDSALTSRLWEITGNVVDYSLSDDLLTGSFTVECTIPATPSYVGSIREVGIYAYRLGLATHSLLVDAEYNPITIEKDDLLELKVRYTIYWKAPGDSNNSRITALPALLHLADGYFPVISGGSGVYPNPCFYVLTTRGTFTRMVNGHKVFFGNEVLGRMTYGSKSWDSTHRTLTFQDVRVPADSFNGAFIEHIALGLSIAVEAEFPNLSLIPLQTLSGMAVGQGDGQTVDFNPPLPFWIEDSEKIYVDGVLQVANVDYTCDFYNNLSGKYQLNPTADALLVGGEIYGSDGADKFLHLRWEYGIGSSDKRSPSKEFSTRMCKYNTLVWARSTTHCIGITTTKPLIFELLLDEDPSKDFSMDTLILEEQYYHNWRARVYCSDDAEAWDLVGEQSMVDRGSSQTPRGRATFTFTRRTKRYWKIEYVSGSMYQNSNYNNINTALYIYGFHTGQKIRFANPPAAGSVITMDAQIDRPYKNDMHVLDYNPILQV